MSSAPIPLSHIWQSHLDKPQRCVVFRNPKQGGLGLPNPEMFFKSLFLRPTYKTLIGPDSPERSLLRFWMDFPLRKHIENIYIGNSTPVAVVERLNFLKEAVDRIRDLILTTTITTGTRMVHRVIYQHWISGIQGPGKTHFWTGTSFGNKLQPSTTPSRKSCSSSISACYRRG